MDQDQSSSTPQAGSDVVLLPVAAGHERSGTLAEWSAGPAGLVVTVRVELAPEHVAELSGQRVWARVESPDGAVRVLEGVVVADAVGASLTMTGMLALAEERRRAAPRVETMLPVKVSLDALALRHASDAHTVDLSRTGARLRMPAASLKASMVVAKGGVMVEVEVAVGATETVTADAEVIRVDAERGEMAVRFVGLQEADAELLDRAVLTTLSAQRTATG